MRAATYTYVVNAGKKIVVRTHSKAKAIRLAVWKSRGTIKRVCVTRYDRRRMLSVTLTPPKKLGCYRGGIKK